MEIQNQAQLWPYGYKIMSHFKYKQTKLNSFNKLPQTAPTG